MKILAIGDIFGRPGRKALRELLPSLITRENADVVIVNAENAAGGRGLTPEVADEILSHPIDILTAGNHTLEYESIFPYLSSHPLLRPANITENVPGRGWMIHTDKKGNSIAVISLQGRVFMEGKGPKVGSPFETVDNLLSEITKKTKIIIVDFSAEVTSEKRALAWHLDGRVSCLFGTHTHVQTSDEEVLPKGTAYISDVGMTGPHRSVVGLDKDVALQRFLTGEKNKFKVAEEDIRLEGIVVEVDETTGHALSIHRVRERCAA